MYEHQTKQQAQISTNAACQLDKMNYANLCLAVARQVQHYKH